MFFTCNYGTFAWFSLFCWPPRTQIVCIHAKWWSDDRWYSLLKPLDLLHINRLLHCNLGYFFLLFSARLTFRHITCTSTCHYLSLSLSPFLSRFSNLRSPTCGIHSTRWLWIYVCTYLDAKNLQYNSYKFLYLKFYLKALWMFSIYSNNKHN